jgi:hypothetical protein
MANKNPLRGSFIADTEVPHAEPHARGLHRPTHKHKVRHKGRPTVEMPRGHGARASAIGKDSINGNRLPGLKEPSGKVRVKGKMSTPHRGPAPVR